MQSTRSSMFSNLRQDGTHAAEWQRFIAIYGPLIEQAVRRAGVSGQDIDDVVQTVLLKLVKVLPSFDYQKSKGFFRHWLQRVSMRQAIDLHRRQSMRPSLLKDPEYLSDRPVTDVIETLEFRRALVQAALQALQHEFRPRTWQCFVQHIQQRQSAADTGTALGISENAVYINSSRVLSRIREFCTFHGEELRHDHDFISQTGTGSVHRQI